MASDSELLRLYVETGSHDAFAELVSRYLPLVYRSALRQLGKDSHRAEDVSQLVFVALARQSRQLLSHSNLAAWLYTTTHRTTCQIIRTEMRRRKREEQWNLQAGSSAPADWTQVGPVLDDALLALDRTERDALLLRFFGNRSFSEIGEALHLGEDASRMRVNRALQRLRDLLGKRGVIVTPSALALFLEAETARGAPSGLMQLVTAIGANTAPAAISTAGAGLSLMAGSKFAGTAAAVVAALALGVAIQQWGALQTEAHRAESTERDLSTVQEKLTRTKRAEQARVTPQGPAGRSGLSTEEQAEFDKGQRFLAEHPEVREAIIRANRAKIRGKYLIFYRDHNLTPAQIDAFETALLAQSSGPVWPNLGFLFINGYQDPLATQQRLHALLGEEAYNDYYRMRMPQPVAGSGDVYAQTIAARLVYSDEPLTAEQCTAIQDITDAAATVAASPTERWKLLIPTLSTVLSRSQMDVVLGLYASERLTLTRTNGRGRIVVP